MLNFTFVCITDGTRETIEETVGFAYGGGGGTGKDIDAAVDAFREGRSRGGEGCARGTFRVADVFINFS